MADAKKEPGLSVKFRQTDIHPQSARVWIEGQEITKGLREFALMFNEGDITEAKFTVAVDDVDIDAQTISMLTAFVERKAAV